MDAPDRMAAKSVAQSAASDSQLALLLSLQQRCLCAADRAELGFLIANDTWQLMPYGTGFVFTLDGFGTPALVTVSGLAGIAEETPYTLWLGRMCRAAAPLQSGTGSLVLTPEQFPAELAESWSEWWPDHAVLVPLMAAGGRCVGFALFVRDTAWSSADMQLLDMLALVWGNCLQALGKSDSIWIRVRRLLHAGKVRWWAAGLLCVALIPVPLSSLAPAEIIPMHAEVVAAPMDGVIKTMHVAPNTVVSKGQVLFSLDDTTLRNRRDVAQQALAVARADALAAQQKAFDSMQVKAELAILTGRVREKEAELAYLDEAFGRVDVRAALDGLFIYGDANDWLGKPVVTGERVGQLAQPNALGVMVWLPVGDAINLEQGAAMKIYLQTAPLSALSATLVQTSYQASLSPEGVASYRIRGRLDEGAEARIGLRGVAKIYGGWRPLAYWVLRRPLGALRQWVGL